MRLLSFAKMWWTDNSHHLLAQRIAASAFMVRLAGAGLLFVIQILLARWMGLREFGIYVYVWTWLCLLGSLAPLGLAYLAQRFIPEYVAARDDNRLRGFLFGARWICFGLGSAAAVVALLAILMLSNRIEIYYIVPLMLALACLPMVTVSDAQESIAYSYNWIYLALTPTYIFRPLALLLIVAALHVISLEISATNVLAVLLVAIWTITLAQLIILGHRLKRHITPGPRSYQVTHWMRTALPIIFVDCFFLLLAYADVLLLELFVEPESIAQYYAATKVVILLSFVHFAVSSACAHRFAEYHSNGDKKNLADFVAKATQMTFWPSCILAAALIVCGRWLLGLFGPAFENGYPLLVVLVIGSLARASIGPAERLLNMVGRQNACALIYAVAVLVDIGFCLILVPLMGPIGAAISTTCALVSVTIMLFLIVRKQLSIQIFVWHRKTEPARAASAFSFSKQSLKCAQENR